MSRIRIGQGLDVHRFCVGRPLRLCGVPLAGPVGLAGHSDADVGLHALTDAVLGAIAAGDIGEHFPPHDQRWRDADSRLFLTHALQLAAAQGYRPASCDLTIVGEWPRIAPYRREMRESLATMLGLSPDAVSVKATTTEGLGFTGRREGLAALAVVLLEQEADQDG